jgi:FHS family L-fucose permease-like MFS transporter
LATAPARAPVASAASGAGASPSYLAPLSILTSLFFMWGFLTCLNDILIPHLKAAFSLTYTQASYIQVCFFAAYFVVSLPAGVVVGKIGYQRGIVVGLLVAATGCLLLYPAAAIRSYGLFLGALFTLAAGITVLQVSANPYVTILGRPETASARLTFTQAFNSFGTILAPFFGGYFILSGSGRSAADLAAGSAVDRAAEVSSVQVPYLCLAATLGVLAIAMALFKLPKVEASASDADASGRRMGAWAHRHLVLGAVGIFVYVGGEVSIGSYLVNFMGLPEIARMTAVQASQYLPLYWGGAMVGRFAGSYLLAKIRPGALLAINAGVASSLVVLSMILGGSAAMWTILAVGLFNSIMFPTIFSLALDGLGPDTEQGSGILCMAIVGGAVVPLIHATLADRIGLHMAFIAPALCYLYIVYYGLKGCQHAPRAHAAPAT